jgi:hypothetical protein
MTWPEAAVAIVALIGLFAVPIVLIWRALK